MLEMPPDDPNYRVVYQLFFSEEFLSYDRFRSAIDNVSQAPYLYFNLTKETKPANDLIPFAVEDVLWIYRLFLLRQPGSFEPVVRAIQTFTSRRSLFDYFLFSPEFSLRQAKQLQLAFPAAQRILFLHVPKSAGSSIVAWMQRHRENVIVLHDYSNQEARVPPNLSAARNELVVSGHVHWDSWNVSSNDYVFSIVREPLARARSFHRFIEIYRRHGWVHLPPPLDTKPELTLADLLCTELDGLRPNEQCRYFSEDGTFVSASANIQRFNVAVWPLSKVADAIARVADDLSIPNSALDILNRIREPWHEGDSSADVANVYQRNLEDLALYNFVLASRSGIDGHGGGSD